MKTEIIINMVLDLKRNYKVEENLWKYDFYLLPMDNDGMLQIGCMTTNNSRRDIAAMSADTNNVPKVKNEKLTEFFPKFLPTEIPLMPARTKEGECLVI